MYGCKMSDKWSVLLVLYIIYIVHFTLYILNYVTEIGIAESRQDLRKVGRI